MHGRKGSKVIASCPVCRLHIEQKAAGTRKESWVECPRCGEVFPAKPKKNSKRERFYQVEEEEDEFAHANKH